MRSRLIDQLNSGLHHKLTLVSAPAGFGKTTLISAWIAASGVSAAWVSLDVADSDLVRFLTYVAAAVRTIAPAAVFSAETTLAALLDALGGIRQQFVLVLDDYHLIASTAVDDALAFLIAHAPPHMHVVITTREDPPLPLARLRARDQITELRTADLRFSTAESAEFLNHSMGLRLASADVRTLEQRTEGWITGLQLAALSLQRHEDATRFIQGFAGDHRYIVDYLVDEVVQHLPDDVRQFLFQTAILDRLSGPLCDAVTEQSSSQQRLEALERSNLFVIPLDDRRNWYRYHHLFAEVLAAHVPPEQVPLLHGRASAWYEQHGHLIEAIRHAGAAGDMPRTANLIEQAVPDFRRSRQDATLRGLLAPLPDDLIRRRPVLSSGYAWAMLAGGQFEVAHAWLQNAEQWLDPAADTERMTVVDQAEFRRLPGTVAIYRAALAQALGDVAATVRYARQALDLIQPDDHLGRGAAVALLGLTSWVIGDLEVAHRTFADGLVHVRMAGNISDTINGTIALADIRVAQGRLHDAQDAYEQAVHLAAAQGETTVRGTADLLIGMSERCYERNDLEAAASYLLQSQESSEQTHLPMNRSRWLAAMAQIREAQGDHDGALDMLRTAEQQYQADLFPDVRPVGALQVRLWLLRGQVAEARAWVQRHRLSAGDEPSYGREFMHLALARVLAASAPGQALPLLGRLLEAAETGQRAGSVLAILLVQALCKQAAGDLAGACAALGRALVLAEPEGYVRTFVDEGPAMGTLLRHYLARQPHDQSWSYAGRLLAACNPDPAAPALLSPATARTSPPQPLAEPLSEREQAVLRLLASDLAGPQIADELMISLNTLRTHTKHIYSKLGVTSRRDAVRLARDLALL